MPCRSNSSASARSAGCAKRDGWALGFLPFIGSSDEWSPSMRGGLHSTMLVSAFGSRRDDLSTALSLLNPRPRAVGSPDEAAQECEDRAPERRPALLALHEEGARGDRGRVRRVVPA